MKITYKSLVDFIESKPSIDELSKYLFQLGHEHEIEDGIFDMEFTPNRGDCLSVKGLLRDLSLFYDINLDTKIYEDHINNFSFKFQNNAVSSCPNISFLKVEIEDEISPYKGKLKDYFDLLKISKNNFFTDVSNYISYEIGQPTHCYDAIKIDAKVTLDLIEANLKFQNLFDKEIYIEGENLLFSMGSDVINLAGVIGGKSSACSSDTRSAIIECAYFNPEDIIGKSIKYDIQSDAAYKFERGVDPTCHNIVLRRFLKVIQDHANIKNVEVFQKDYQEYNKIRIPFDVNKINKIIGTNKSTNQLKVYLSKLGFKIIENMVEVPPYRNDIKNQNDLAEEVARSIGYDNISVNEINIPSAKNTKSEEIEIAIKNLLTDNGFYEVINDPFSSFHADFAIKLDNPLDSNREYLRTNLKQSLIDNLLYNERRQKDSIKLFEISNIYPSHDLSKKKRTLGIIASGRVGKNFIDFPRKINADHLNTIISIYINNKKFEDIPRNTLNTKIKNEISYIEIELDEINKSILGYAPKSKSPSKFTKYKPISEFPSSSRDLSFSVKDFSILKKLEEYILNFKDDILKEVFIFDFYHNEKDDEVKIGFRFVFQSDNSTITETEVKQVMDTIIEYTLNAYDVSLPGL